MITDAALKIKDSGDRRDFGTGSVRDVREGKGRFDLLLRGWAAALKQLARHLEEGAKKYGDNNWRKGQPLMSYLDSALRHLAAFAEGKTDEPHLLSAIWNLICMLQTFIDIQAGRLPQTLDDRDEQFSECQFILWPTDEPSPKSWPEPERRTYCGKPPCELLTDRCRTNECVCSSYLLCIESWDG